MQFIESLQATFGGRFELSHLFLVIFVFVTLVVAERYYNRKR
jgi:hypothetical protein